MGMVGRQYSAGNAYRYGFNGKEKDKDITVGGQDYGLRIYDSRLGKFLSVDPLSKSYPFYSTYHFAGNMPIRCIDLEGGEPLDRVQNWQGRQMIINDTRKSNVEVEYSPAMGVYSYEAIYDQVTKQHWFVMHNQDGTYSYWKHNEGADRLRLKQSTSGEGNNGQWESFITADQRDAKVGAESAELLAKFFVAVFTLPFAIEAYSATSAIAGTTYVGRGIFDASTDVTAQLATNGGSVRKINRTSVVLSFFVPGNSLKTILAKNAIANYAAYDGNGYSGIGSAGYNMNNFASDGISTLTGAATDKFFSSMGNRPTATSAQLGRWHNLSYNTKYINLLKQDAKNHQINNFLNSFQGRAMGGIITNVVTNMNNMATPKQDPSTQLGFH